MAGREGGKMLSEASTRAVKEGEAMCATLLPEGSGSASVPPSAAERC